MKRLHWGREASRALLTALALCVAALAVRVGDVWEARTGARLDLSFNGITTKSEATEAVLAGLTRDVRAYAVFSDGSEDAQLVALLDRYQAATPHFVWSRENLTRNPLLLQWVSDEQSDSAVTSDCLIVRCEETGRTRVLTAEDYIAYGYDLTLGAYTVSGWTYEKSLTEAVLYVTTDELPRLQILSGHGELDAGTTAVMERRLRESNYALSRVQLLRGDTLDPAWPLMILSPTLDVTEGELAQLLDFVHAGGSLFITVDYTDPDELPNLYALYALYGFAPRAGVVVADAAESGTYYDSVSLLTPEMLSTDMTEMLVSGGADTVILPGARAIDAVPRTDGNLLLSVVLQSGESAYLRPLDSEGLQREAGDPTGPFALALTADRGFDEGARSRAFIIGNSSLFLDEWMYSYTYSPELLLQAAQYLTGGGAIDLAIVARDAVRPQLLPENNAAPAVLLTLPPLLTAALALALLRPRRHL